VNKELEKFISDHNPADVKSGTIEDLRKSRNECNQVETDVSFIRRLTQGRLDIVGHEVQRRTDEGAGLNSIDASGILYELPDILRDNPVSGAGRRRVDVTEPGEMASVLSNDLDALISPQELAGIESQDEKRLAEIFASLQEFESVLSHARKSLHEKIDEIQLEIGRRYSKGEASISSLLSQKS